ncbi:MAG: hypothetical protein ACLT1J_08215 [Mediterraneibacter gnavus]
MQALQDAEKQRFVKKIQDAIDLVCMCRLNTVIFTKSQAVLKRRKIKANERLMLRENWELYYYWMIRYLLWYSPERQIVIPTIRKIMEFLTADYIPYTVVYPERERKEEYEGRYRNRGDSESFLDVFIGRWDDMLDGLEQYGKKQIALQEGQYLSDVVSCMPTDDVYMSRQLVRFAEHLTQETSLAKKLRELREKFPEKAEKGQCARRRNRKSINGRKISQKGFKRTVMTRTNCVLFCIMNRSVKKTSWMILYGLNRKRNCSFYWNGRKKNRCTL